ncbi:MAG: hypothetical protein FD180_507 [Planctomycetota bacterium]|nr:MAG: hypothetical protein FD180_507 [Planctomycetota bacterium]
MWPFRRKARSVDPAAFSILFEERLRKAGEQRPVVRDMQEFALVVGDGALRIFLRNHFDEYNAAAESDRDRLLTRAVRAAVTPLEIPPTFAAALPALLPRLRVRVFHEFLRLRSESGGPAIPEIPYRAVAGHFAASLAYDGPDSVAAVSATRLDEWKTGFDEAMAAALANLERRSGEKWERPHRGVLASPWRDDHDASRILLVDLVRGLGLKGDPVAMIPSQNQVLLAGSGDHEGLASMANLAGQSLRKPRAMSGVAIRLAGREWKPFDPGDGSPLAWALRAFRLHSISQEYAEQKDLLQAHFAARKEEIYVAALMLIRSRDSDRVSSLTTWTEGVETLLPEAEAIGFMQVVGGEKSEMRGMVSWERAAAVLGSGLNPEGMYPARYRVNGFPTEEQFAEMGV